MLLHIVPGLGNGTICWLPWEDLGLDFDGFQQYPQTMALSAMTCEHFAVSPEVANRGLQNQVSTVEGGCVPQTITLK